MDPREILRLSDEALRNAEIVEPRESAGPAEEEDFDYDVERDREDREWLSLSRDWVY